jgi:hypothetical protein
MKRCVLHVCTMKAYVEYIWIVKYEPSLSYWVLREALRNAMLITLWFANLRVSGAENIT